MEEKVHKRRERYSGTHPKRFKEKYKELNPEKYGETVEKIIKKGNTPAGMHISIMVNEIIEFLDIKPTQKGLDATLGYGGHTSHMLNKLEGKGHIFGLDIDPIEIEKTRKRLADLGYNEEILTILHQNFEGIDKVAEKYGPFDFILADLGVSSMQIDNPERGFTFKRDGALDLRLNPEAGISAAERLLSITQPELEGMLVENSDEPFAYEISKAVVRSIKKGTPVDTTQKLREIISDVVSNALRNEPAKARAEAVKKSCQRTFQALRIDVNNEYEVLYSFLEKLPDALAPGGRVAILTFHSGEDRLVKKSFKELSRAGIYSEVARDVVRPSDEECKQNARARSTKMRWAIKA